MTLYAIHCRPDALPIAVAERFNWFAALLPPVHALAYRAWDQFFGFVVGVAIVVAAGRFAGLDTAIWLYVLLALGCGFAAPGAERRALQKRGFVFETYRLAINSDLARLSAMEARP